LARICERIAQSKSGSVSLTEMPLGSAWQQGRVSARRRGERLHGVIPDVEVVD